jgi:hypothetical protein
MNFTKSLDPHLAEIEIEKSIWAHNLGLSSGLFYCPKVLGYETPSLLVLEMLDNTIPVRDAIESGIVSAEDIICRLGAILSAIHAAPHPGGPVIHSDFNLINVAYSPNTNQVVIFDWGVSPALVGYSALRLSQTLDIVSFLRALLLQLRPRVVSFSKWPQRVRLFIDSYNCGLKSPILLNNLWGELYSLQTRCMRKQLSQKKFRSLSYELGSVLYVFLIRRLFWNGNK